MKWRCLFFGCKWEILMETFSRTGRTVIKSCPRCHGLHTSEHPVDYTKKGQ